MKAVSNMSAHPPRRGITLIEVLIAIGILAVGLSSVVALIPAGRSQASRALVLDRASNLAANALSDAATFGLLRPDSLTATAGLLVIDPLELAGIGTFASTGTSGIFSSGTATAAAPTAAQLLFTQGRDDLLFAPGATDDDPPLNMFSDGVRSFQGRTTVMFALQMPVFVPSVTLSGTTVINQAVVDVPSTTGLFPGMTVTGNVIPTVGPGIPTPTKIVLINSALNKVTLSNNCTANGSGVRLDFHGTPGTISAIVFHGRDPGALTVSGTITNGVVTFPGVSNAESVAKPGVVLLSGDITARYRLHQALSVSMISNQAFMTFSSGNPLLTGTHSLIFLPDSVGLAERTFTAEESGPYLQ